MMSEFHKFFLSPPVCSWPSVPAGNALLEPRDQAAHVRAGGGAGGCSVGQGQGGRCLHVGIVRRDQSWWAPNQAF